MKLAALLALAITLFAGQNAADKGYGVDPNGLTSSDIGCGIDPNGCSGSYDGGGAMDPNGADSGIDSNCYSACLDPNG
jgi:hypothetical protein